MEKTDHHYIPKKYLSYFTDPFTPKGQTPYVWYFDREKELIRNKSPKNVGYLPKCYNIVDSVGNISSIVEDQLGKIENRAKPVLRKISELKRISRKERMYLSEYIFSMTLRVPRYWKIYNDAVVSGDIYKLGNEKIKFNDLPSNLPMDSIPRVASIGGKLLLSMQWTLLISPEGTNFITSDNPVVIRDPKNPGMKMCGFNSSPDVQVTFPLNKKMCLFGTWYRYRRIVERVTSDEVETINFETFKYSNKYLYASTPHFQKEIILVNHLVNIGEIH